MEREKVLDYFPDVNRHKFVYGFICELGGFDYTLFDPPYHELGSIFSPILKHAFLQDKTTISMGAPILTSEDPDNPIITYSFESGTYLSDEELKKYLAIGFKEILGVFLNTYIGRRRIHLYPCSSTEFSREEYLDIKKGLVDV